MAETVTLTLTHAQLRTLAAAVECDLRENFEHTRLAASEQEALVRGFFALTAARNVPGGLRPHELTLPSWAVEALARIIAPPPPVKKAKPAAPKTPATPKRRRTDKRTRHDKPAARPRVEEEPPLPMDSVDETAAEERVQ